MPNTQLLITMLQGQVKDQKQQIKIQYQQILHLQQDVARLHSVLDAREDRIAYREGSE